MVRFVQAGGMINMKKNNRSLWYNILFFFKICYNYKKYLKKEETPYYSLGAALVLLQVLFYCIKFNIKTYQNFIKTLSKLYRNDKITILWYNKRTAFYNKY